jgi:hypothetical protein
MTFEKRYWVQVLFEDEADWKTVKRTASLDRAMSEWQLLCANEPKVEIRVWDKVEKKVLATNHQAA